MTPRPSDAPRRTAALLFAALLVGAPAAAAAGPWVGAPEAKMTPDELDAWDRFPRAMAVGPDRIVTGNPMGDADSGEVFVHERAATGPALETVLQGPTGDAELGSAVDLDRDTLVAGASGIDTGGAFEAGAAVVYEKGPSGWTKETRLEPPEPEALDAFGRAVAVDGGTVAVGEPEDEVEGEYASNGAVHLFEEDADGNWVLETTLTPPADDDRERLGYTLALQGDTLVAGAPEDETANGTGAVYVYEDTSSGWTQTDRLVASPELGARQLGQAVDLDGDVLVAGAPGPQATICCDPTPDGPEGHAFVWTRTDTGAWAYGGELDPAASAPAASVGLSAAVDDGTAYVGSPNAPLDTARGSVAAFEEGDDGWEQTGRALAPTAGSGDHVGHTVAADGGLLLAGAPGDDDQGHNAGAAHLFTGASAPSDLRGLPLG